MFYLLSCIHFKDFCYRFIIQFAGEINPRDKGALLVSFGIGGIALFVLIRYMYVYR